MFFHLLKSSEKYWLLLLKSDSLFQKFPICTCITIIIVNASQLSLSSNWEGNNGSTKTLSIITWQLKKPKLFRLNERILLNQRIITTYGHTPEENRRCKFKYLSCRSFMSRRLERSRPLEEIWKFKDTAMLLIEISFRK